jgi:hypothetical protein
VAKKKVAKSRNPTSTKRPAPKKSAALKKQDPLLKGAKLTGAGVGSSGFKLLSEAVALQCPTHVYDGVVILSAARTAFLRTAGGTYLMLLDPDCSGTYTSGRVDAAYAAFSQNPGANQRLVCNGFLHEDGTTQVLHVVR